MKMSNLFIYFIIDPRNGNICYVGQTRRGKTRFTQHTKNATENPTYHGMKRLYSWIAKLIQLGFKPEYRIVEYIDSIDELDSAEIYWGELCKSLGCPLKNIASFGCNGKWFLTEEGREKLSEGRMGALHPMYGKKHKHSTIEKMKIAHVGKQWTPEQIEKRAAKRRKPFICSETGERFECIRDFIEKGHGTSRIKDVLNKHAETYHGYHYVRIA